MEVLYELTWFVADSLLSLSQHSFVDFFLVQVIVMEHTWKSSLNRHTMAYLNPNPFYLGVARMLLIDHEVRGFSILLFSREGYLNSLTPALTFPL